MNWLTYLFALALFCVSVMLGHEVRVVEETRVENLRLMDRVLEKQREIERMDKVLKRQVHGRGYKKRVME